MPYVTYKHAILALLLGALAVLGHRACTHKPDMAAIVRDACPPGFTCRLKLDSARKPTDGSI